MRPKERIPLFIKKINIEKLIERWFGKEKSLSSSEITKKILSQLYRILGYWNDNPDLRFSQVLVNLEYVPNIPGMWYHEEDTEILIEQGCKLRDVILWGRNFTKDGERLPETQWILLKHLSTDHIHSILISEFLHLDVELKQCFEDEIELRKTDLSLIPSNY